MLRPELLLEGLPEGETEDGGGTFLAEEEEDDDGAPAGGDRFPLPALPRALDGGGCCCLKGDPLTPLETRTGERSMFWFTCLGEEEEEVLSAAEEEEDSVIWTTEVLEEEEDAPPDMETTEVLGVAGCCCCCCCTAGGLSCPTGGSLTPLFLVGLTDDPPPPPLWSNWFLMASKFFPENVLDTTVFCTLTWLEEEDVVPAGPVVVDEEDRFCSKMEIRSEIGLLPADGLRSLTR